jgi:hypothetical protein
MDTADTTDQRVRQLSIGKMRGLQQISNAHGFFTMTALDHRGSMQRMIAPRSPEAVTNQLTRYKRDLTRALAPVSSAVLIDPIYGAAQVIAGGDRRVRHSRMPRVRRGFCSQVGLASSSSLRKCASLVRQAHRASSLGERSGRKR